LFIIYILLCISIVSFATTYIVLNYSVNVSSVHRIQACVCVCVDSALQNNNIMIIQFILLLLLWFMRERERHGNLFNYLIYYYYYKYVVIFMENHWMTTVVERDIVVLWFRDLCNKKYILLLYSRLTFPREVVFGRNDGRAIGA